MRTFITILFTLLLLNNLKGQEYDIEFYLFGTIDDFSGPFYPKKNPAKAKFDVRVHEDNQGVIKRIEEVSSLQFKRMRKKRNCRNCQEFYKLGGINSSWKLGEFYSFTIDKSNTRRSKKCYTGTFIKESILNSIDINKLSYLAGVFLESGTIEKNIFIINLYNAPAKFDCIKELLIEFDAEILSEMIEQTMPVLYQLKFQPNEKIERILRNEIERKDTLANSKSWLTAG